MKIRKIKVTDSLATLPAAIGLTCLLNLSALAQIGPIPPPPGLVAWWPGDGDAKDIVGTNDGELLSGATFTAGIVGQAFTFDGSGARVVATTFGLPVGANDRTLELWVRADAFLPAPDHAFLAGYGAFDNQEATFELGAYSDGALWWSAWGPSFSGSQLPTGEWCHVGVTSESGTIKLYINGTEAGSESLPFNTPDNTTFYLGALPYGGVLQRLQGALDEVCVYDRALSAEEIYAIYAAGSAGKIKPVQPGPQLNIVSSGGVILVWWPANALGFVLETSPDLGPNPNWSTFADPIIVIGDQNLIAVTAKGSSFFRLHKP